MGGPVLADDDDDDDDDDDHDGVSCFRVKGKMDEFAISAEPVINGGILSGSFEGDYTFTMTTMTDSTTEGVVLFSGDSMFETDAGDLYFTEAGSLDTVSPGRFADLLTVAGGTGQYAGATGQLYLVGNFDLAAGDGKSRYRGRICTPCD